MDELTISYAEIAIRLLAAVVLCGVIGFEREVRDHSAGFRTHILLGLGAALFTLVSAYGYPEFTAVALESEGRGVQFDPTRITAQIVTGIGFLGAGAILRQGINVRGLTTATSLWATAAIGTAAGAGFYFGAVAATAAVILSLTLLRGIKTRIVPRFRSEYGIMNVVFEGTGNNVSEIIERLEVNDIGTRIMEMEFENGCASYTIRLRAASSANVQDALDEVHSLPNVRRVNVSGLEEIE